MSDSSSPTPSPWAVLKIALGDEFRREALRGARDYEVVDAVLRAVWSGPGEAMAYYEDEEGDECRLVRGTFADFLSTAKPTFEEAAENGGRPVLKVRLRLPATQPLSSTGGEGATEHASGPERSTAAAAQCEPSDDSGRHRSAGGGGESSNGGVVEEDAGCGSSPPAGGAAAPDRQGEGSPNSKASDDQNSGSDLEEEDAAALVEEARRACEGVLAEHLRAWLAAGPPSATFEAWMRDVHPENARHGTVDKRMYLEASFHRQLWNELAAGAAGLTEEERGRRLVPAKQGSAAAESDLTPSAPLLSELVPVPAEELLASSPDTTPSAPLLSELVPAQRGTPAAGTAGVQEGSGPAAEAAPQPVWKLAAAPYIARALPVGAQILRKLRHRTDLAEPTLPEKLRSDYEVLGVVLADFGPQFGPVAEAAADLASGAVLHGTGVAELATKASRLSLKDRLRYADALCDCCPDAILSCFPEFARPARALQGGPETAGQVRAAGRAARREHQEAVKAAKNQFEAEMKLVREAQRQAPGGPDHKKAIRQLVEEQQRAARQAAQVHAQTCRQAMKAHAAAAKAAAEAQKAAWRRAAQVHSAAAATQR